MLISTWEQLFINCLKLISFLSVKKRYVFFYYHMVFVISSLCIHFSNLHVFVNMFRITSASWCYFWGYPYFSLWLIHWLMFVWWLSIFCTLLWSTTRLHSSCMLKRCVYLKIITKVFFYSCKTFLEFSMCYFMQILENYKDIINQINHFYVQDKLNLKVVLSGLTHCLSLLPCDESDAKSHKEVSVCILKDRLHMKRKLLWTRTLHQG